MLIQESVSIEFILVSFCKMRKQVITVKQFLIMMYEVKIYKLQTNWTMAINVSPILTMTGSDGTATGRIKGLYESIKSLTSRFPSSLPSVKTMKFNFMRTTPLLKVNNSILHK
jgi:hypothetical protein